MLMLSLLLFGGISFNRLGVSRLPDVDAPFITITLTMEGASPFVMETDVVDPVEEAVTGVEGVVEIRSMVREGSATVTAELDTGVDVNASVQEVDARLSRAMRNLPTDLDPPVITKTNPDDAPILWIVVTSDRSLRERMLFVRNTLLDEFRKIPGVGEITMGGYVDRNIRIWPDLKRMATYEFTADDITSAIRSGHVEMPAGRLEEKSGERSLRASLEMRRPEDFKNLMMIRRGSSPVRNIIHLSDIAAVEDGLDDIRRISRLNGEPAVGIGIRKATGTNAVRVADLVKRKLAEIKRTLPEGYRIEIATDNSEFIRESVNELLFTLILSVILTAAATYLFLGSVESSLNVLIALPTSLIGAFTVLYLFGFTLNSFTLLALMLGAGILVDDAIMVLENIQRRFEEGESALMAALNGAREIAFAALAASLAVVAIFLPVAFMSGVTGRFFYEFGITVSAAVMISLIEALTLTPMRMSRFGLKRVEAPSRFSPLRMLDRLIHRYTIALKWALDRPGLTLILSLAFFGSLLLLFIPLKKEFLPREDQSRLLIRVRTAPDASLALTDSIVKKIESRLSQRGEVLRHFSAVGGFAGDASDEAMLVVTLRPPSRRPVTPEVGSVLSQSELAAVIRKDLNENVKGARISVIDASQQSFTGRRGYPVELTIRGPDHAELHRFSERIVRLMHESGVYSDIEGESTPSRPELRIVPDRTKAIAHGIDMESIAHSLSALVAGTRVALFSEGGRNYDVRMRLPDSAKNDPATLAKIPLRNNYGEIVPLGSVVRFESGVSVRSISRTGRERSVNIEANPSPRFGQDEAARRALEIADSVLPEGYRAVLTGQARESRDSRNSLIFALLLGVIISYMILGSQFNSFIHPLTVLLALPFAFGGAAAALLISGNTLNLYSLIGIILLSGLVKKNSILIVDFAKRYQSEGISAQDALMRACPLRLRPILMTSFTTIAAAIPPALSAGPGAESHAPMAVVVIGGMLLSTLISLFAVPAAYLLFSKKLIFFKRG